MADAGQDAEESLDVETAVCATRVLGALQARAAGELTLANRLPNCGSRDLWDVLLRCVDWGQRSATPELIDRVADIQHRLPRAEGFVREVEQRLQTMPDVLVHGDFWRGNVAVEANNVRLLDWGDALWGVGGISIVNLLASEDSLTPHTARIWDAYELGLQTPVSSAYRAACAFAYHVVRLVVDREIATCCGRSLRRLPGFLPGLETILELAIP